jgi:hypothetical protein
MFDNAKLVLGVAVKRGRSQAFAEQLLNFGLQ